MKVLIIEDDAETAGFIARGLREAGSVVDHAETGVDGLFLASEGAYDVLVVEPDAAAHGWPRAGAHAA